MNQVLMKTETSKYKMPDGDDPPESKPKPGSGGSEG